MNTETQPCTLSIGTFFKMIFVTMIRVWCLKQVSKDLPLQQKNQHNRHGFGHCLHFLEHPFGKCFHEKTIKYIWEWTGITFRWFWDSDRNLMTESNIKAIFKFLSKGPPRLVITLLSIVFRECAYRKKFLGPQCSIFGALCRTGNEQFRTKVLAYN